MKNKRGFTLVELLVSFVLITAVSVALFRTTLSMQQKQQVNLAKNKYKAFTTVLNNTIQKDFLTDRILSMTENDTNSFEIVYEKKGKVNFTVDRENNTIIYGGTKEKLPSDYKFYDDVTIRFYDNTAATEGLNSHVVITIPVKSGLEPDLDEIKYMYQYNNVEHKIDVDTSLGNNYRGATKIKDLVNPQGSNGVISANGIRYVGANPNNYVYFNCSDKDSTNIAYGQDGYNYASSCEVWRIVGVFDVASTINGPTQSRIKLIRDKLEVGMDWDSTADNINVGCGANAWEQSDLKTMLNTYYLGNTNSCLYCIGKSQEICQNNCSSDILKLSNTSINMISDAIWHLGSIEYLSDLTLEQAYNAERGGLNGKELCTKTNGDSYYECNDNFERHLEWEGKVGLIYPSDYGYASTNENCPSKLFENVSTCNIDNWLHINDFYWTITPLAYLWNSSSAWSVTASSGVAGIGTWGAVAVRPSVYLKSEVQIIDGNGASSKTTDGTGPYVLKLD